MTTPLRIGVAPATELTRRARLLDALAQAYPVEFVAPDAGAEALVTFGVEAAGDVRVPALSLLHDESAEAGDEPTAVTLSGDDRLARPLRGASLTDRHVGAIVSGSDALAAGERLSGEGLSGDALTGEPLAGDLLAAAGGRPLWWRAGAGVEVGAAAPLELDESEALRDRLAPGRNLALLPLAHFLANLTADRRWQPGPLRAAIILDDPNLHWPTYGRVRYAEMARHAAEHDYHVSMATVPLDAWLVNPRVARLFAAASDRLSLCIHGNDHTGPELGRPRSDAEGTALAAEALKRIERFERRSGVAVSRVMVPPHERVSEPAARALRACDYDAICTTRPYPWMVSQLRAPWLTRPPEAGPLAGWHTVDVVAGGLPVLLRSAFRHPREDLVLRAFLGQPLIVYGHHDDLDGDLDLLAQVAADVNRLGDVDWCPLGDMARASVETRVEGDALHVRPRARRVRVDVPASVRRLEVDLSVLGLPPDAPLHANGGTVSGDATVAVDGPGSVDLEAGSAPVPPSTARTPAYRRAWPLARRWASEVRDRVEPVRTRPASAER